MLSNKWFHLAVVAAAVLAKPVADAFGVNMPDVVTMFFTLLAGGSGAVAGNQVAKGN